MPRKGKLERVQPTASRGSVAANKYDHWRHAVKDLLMARWQSSADIESVAATVVGMFDAGAKDVEVAAFLHSQEQSSAAESSLTDEARLALVQGLLELGRRNGDHTPLRAHDRSRSVPEVIDGQTPASQSRKAELRDALTR